MMIKPELEVRKAKLKIWAWATLVGDDEQTKLSCTAEDRLLVRLAEAEEKIENLQRVLESLTGTSGEGAKA